MIWQVCSWPVVLGRSCCPSLSDLSLVGLSGREPSRGRRPSDCPSSVTQPARSGRCAVPGDALLDCGPLTALCPAALDTLRGHAEVGLGGRVHGRELTGRAWSACLWVPIRRLLGRMARRLTWMRVGWLLIRV